jgi:hypothetical protein
MESLVSCHFMPRNIRVISEDEINCELSTVELLLSWRCESGLPIIRIGLALPVNIIVLYLYYIFLWLERFPQLSNTYNELCINVLFVRKYI